MTGGILQLVARGYDDLYIIKDPEITYFKIVYRRYTNFSFYPKELYFNNNISFGHLGKCDVKTLGDVLYKLYLAIDIPAIDVSNTIVSVNDLIGVLGNYDIVLNYNGNIYNPIYIIPDNIDQDPNQEPPYLILYALVKSLIEAQINTLLISYNAEKNIKIKNTILNKLKNIGFLVNNNWMFPDLPTILGNNFKHNKLSFDLYGIFKTGYAQFAWVKELAHYLVEYIEVSIGGVIIDKQDSNIIRANSIINLDENKQVVYEKMIGNVPELYTYDSKPKPAKRLYLPLTFWFCQNAANALPIVALPHTEININVKFRKFTDVCYFTNYTFKKTPILNTHIIAHYIYVENDERERLAETKHEYLIETYEINQEENFNKSDLFESKEQIIDINTNTLIKEQYVSYKLSFNYLVKQIFWIVKPLINLSNFDKFNWNFGYIPVNNFKIKLNGRTRETLKDYKYYQYWQSEKSFCSSLVPNLFLYNFAIYPQMLQPSGQINFGLLQDASLELYLNNILVDQMENYNYNFKVNAYAKSHNILRIFSGMAGLAFY